MTTRAAARTNFGTRDDPYVKSARVPGVFRLQDLSASLSRIRRSGEDSKQLARVVAETIDLLRGELTLALSDINERFALGYHDARGKPTALHDEEKGSVLATEILRKASPAKGDLIGTYPSPKVCGLHLGPHSELTISSGAITVTGAFHTVDTQSDASSDDLDTINGGTVGSVLVLRAEDSARTVVCKDGVDNLQLNGDFSLDNAWDTITLIYMGTTWLELSRSDNAA